ncbi:hypothetical protein K488DRAFT_83606 [Vararia minispora EC-137]|uniref:Uncharacterized protein n=1 Tax=Vararia minispora EC-137 TaxID=1314806 RepID=A0ACB8QTW0_9AGAM|nr:hypothetical protein K488DRAFT_83606 [Vararia minispora EC-137]
MAQVSHATAAVLHETRERAETLEYLADLKNMHTVVLQVSSAEAIRAISQALSAPVVAKSGLPLSLPPHHIWIEQPENEPSCLALAPNRRGDKAVRKVLDKAGCRVWRS